MLRTNTIEASTLELLKTLQQILLFRNLRLVGGTALALRMGHRHSIDLDLFGMIDADYMEISEVLQENKLKVTLNYNSKNIHQFTINDVKVDIVNYPYEWIEPQMEMNNIRLAGLKDIAAMKLSAITNRGTRKDFVDIYFLLQTFSLADMLLFYKQKYKDNSEFMVIKSLSYFIDAEEEPMPKMYIKTEWESIKKSIQEELNRVANI